MNYYWFNRQELLKKAKEKYCNNGGKEKAAKYCKHNKDVIKKARNTYKNLTEKEKELKRQYSKNSYYKIKSNYGSKK